ncbi:hypothetical protein BKA60DRAFT_304659 [Fusarium oxysporum]|nr:hypothetical protein BKA60DRAFT_304659 [Fusarium oxysporum]
MFVFKLVGIGFVAAPVFADSINENQPKERFGAQHHTDIGIYEQLIHRLGPFGGDCIRVQLQHYNIEPLRLPKLFVSDLKQHL